MKRPLKIVLFSFGALALAGSLILVYLWHVCSSNLPYIGALEEYKPPIITKVFSSDGEVIGRFWEEKRIIVPLDVLPQHLIEAFVAAEDAKFFEHEGLDFTGIIRAFFVNLKAGRIVQGASTITQQVARSLLLKNTEKTYIRKAKEALLSLQIEDRFSKERILFLYLNQIYLGHGAYGVEAAARTYFGKSAKDLTLPESAMLAGLPQAPSLYSPVINLEKAQQRKLYVLERMREEGFIGKEEFKRACYMPINIVKEAENAFDKAPYFTEHVRRLLLEKYGREALYRQGLKVYTTLDLKMQKTARSALEKGLCELDKREGYRGPVRHLTPKEVPRFVEEAKEKFNRSPPQVGSVVLGLVEKVNDSEGYAVIRLGELVARLPISEMEWAREPDPEVPYYDCKVSRPSEVLEPNDVIRVRVLGKKTSSHFDLEVALEQIPEVEGALFCMVPETGEVRAMIGGRDFDISQFNRAVQSRRQPGSTFKPVIYAAALDQGMTPAEVLIDAPYISKEDPETGVWKPKNYKDRFFGPTLFRSALVNSRNVITVKILKEIGIDYTVNYARKLGIKSSLSPDLSLALGSSGVSLLELTRAYAVFASGGWLVEPIFIKKVVDREGNILEENDCRKNRAISKQTAFVMTDLLEAVVQEGTGWRIKALDRPVAGKTGTTDDLRDAWFVGYVPGLATGVWVGYDDCRSMGKGETGSRAAAPIWLDFMKEVLKDRPVEDFEVPDGIVFAEIDTKTGLLAGPYSKDTVEQAFRKGKQPKELSPKPGGPKAGQFLQFDMETTQ